MDTLDYYNTISEPDYKSLLSDALLQSYKSITFTFNNAIRILSVSSKKQILGPLNPGTQAAGPFASLLTNVQEFSRDVETFGKSIFDRL
jgi:hypothetical protein